MRKSFFSAAVLAAHEVERSLRHGERSAAASIPKVATVARRGGHVAQGHAASGSSGPIRLRAVDQVDVVQRYLAGVQDDVVCGARIEFIAADLQREAQAIGAVEVVLADFAPPMRTRNDAQTAVFGSCGVDGNPDGARCQWPDRPVFPVLMPGRFGTDSGGFGKEAGVPQGEVRTDQLFDHVEHGRHAGDVEEGGVEGQQRRAVVGEFRMLREVGGRGSRECRRGSRR